jgi:hypothetical protein
MAVAGTINSDIVAAGQGTPSVYPGTVKCVYGSVTIPAGTSFATTDSLVLFSAPGPNTSIVGFWLDIPALTGLPTLSLTDGTNTIATVTSTVAAAGGFVDEATNTTHAKIGNGVQYTSATAIKLIPVTGTTSTVGASAVVLYFAFDIVNF